METESPSPWVKSERSSTLSLSMIIKNEVDTLERCLRSARPHVDELVIVDTGSTDGSRRIAQKYADVYEEIEWPNSFSKARNHSFGLASCDYIMYLDGDEYMPNPFHWEMIREGICHPNIVMLQLRLRNLLPEGGLLQSSTIWHERVMLNHPDIRWEGKVHNQIRRSVERHIRRTDMKVGQLPAEIIHTGYALPKKKKQEKYSVRIPLLRDEFENPTSAVTRAYYGFQLGLVYLVMGKTEKSHEIFGGLNYELLNSQNSFYAHYLAAKAAMGLNELEAAMQHCEAMFQITRTEPIAFFTLAHILLLQRKLYEGVLALVEAFTINEKEKSTARFRMNEDTLLNALVDVCRKANFTSDAVSVLEKYVKHAGENEAAKRLVRAMKKTTTATI